MHQVAEVGFPFATLLDKAWMVITATAKDILSSSRDTVAHQSSEHSAQNTLVWLESSNRKLYESRPSFLPQSELLDDKSEGV